MSKKVKVVGYAKREFYGNGIEYRDISADVSGSQNISEGGVYIYNLGGFNVTTNLDQKIDKNYLTGSFSKYYSLNKLKFNEDKSLLGFEDNSPLKLNLDKTDLSSYAYFGSLREFIRVSLENIIINWPASLYVSKVNNLTPEVDNKTYNTDYHYTKLTNISTFSINIESIINDFGINIKKDGTILNTFNAKNKLRDFNLSFDNYVLSVDGEDYNILGFEGHTNTTDKIQLVVEGDPFGGRGNIDYHIKPNQLKYNEFFFGLSDFEGHVLNRNTTPQFKANFTFNYETENGTTIIGEKVLTWPISDGYNIDFNSEYYGSYVKELLRIADLVDDSRANIITNRLVSKSIIEFDTIDQKMDKTLKIYGRNLDEIKKHITGLKFINTVTYDKKNNVPDRLVKNLARTLGWELTSSLFNIDFNDDFLSTTGNLNLSPVESEIEFWRRLILNSPWVWKSKGTRKVVEFLLRFVGTPVGLVTFNEYVHVASNTLRMDEFKKILELNGKDYKPEDYVVDKDGYPKTMKNNAGMYFQKGGMWYRQTSGEDSNVDILTGNNPHIGPYDNGYEYINQYNAVIPDFESVELTSVKVFSEIEQTFLNYDEGIFDGMSDQIGTIINSHNTFFDRNNLPLDSSIIEIQEEIIEAPKSDDGAAYKVSIIRKLPIEGDDCDYSMFKLDGNGLLLFTHESGLKDNYIASECCTGLGFTPEINDQGRYVCRWKEVESNPCNNFSLTGNFNNKDYATFINYETGAIVDTVPTSECCTRENLAFEEENGEYHCLKIIETNACEEYFFTGNFEQESNESYAVFQYKGSDTTSVGSPECCSLNGFAPTTVNGEIRCIEDSPNCDGYIIDRITEDGYVIFENTDGILVDVVGDIECCETHGFQGKLQLSGGVKCFELRLESLEPKLILVERRETGNGEAKLFMKVQAQPNTVVRYRISVLDPGENGFYNTIYNRTDGTNVTPSRPTFAVGSYCEGSLQVGSTGEADIEMNTMAKAPSNVFNPTCVSLAFAIFNLDNVTLDNNNKLVNNACYKF